MQKVFFLVFILQEMCFPQQWELLGLEKERINAITINPLNNSIIYAGSMSSFSDGIYGKLFKSTDFGNTWDTLLYNLSVQDIAVHPKKPNIIYVALASTNYTRSGILKSIDSGTNWFWADSGITLTFEVSVATVVPHPDSIDVVYAGTGGIFGGYVCKSINGGSFWSQYPADVMCCQFEDIFFDPVEHSTIYVGSGKLYRSLNNGKSWSVVHDWTSESGGVKLAIDNKNNNILYAGLPGYRMLKSIDYGGNWFYADSGMTRNNYWDLFFQPGSNKVLYTVSGGGVFKTEDSAGLWTGISEGFSEETNFRTLVISSSAENLYCGTDSGLYKLYLGTSIKNKKYSQLGRFLLLQNYPNPFNLSTIISFSLLFRERVKITLYNTVGEKVETILNKQLNAGIHSIEFNAKNLSSGIYFYQIEAGKFQDVKKLIVLK